MGAKKHLPRLSLVLGGASSGKSRFAENLVISSGLQKVYVATARAFDAEMTAKIAAHKNARGPDWTTIEAPLDIAAALGGIGADQAVLIDCATLWLTNLLLAEADIEAAEKALFGALKGCPAPVVLVSNEVGQGIVPENQLARRFRTLQGQFNQRAAERAQHVVAVMAGLPMVLKDAP